MSIAIPERPVLLVGTTPGGRWMALPAVAVFFDNATRDDMLHASTTGTRIGQAQHDALQSLLNTLKPCARDGRHVILEIAGFSSAADFRNSDRDASRRVNLELANRRAVIVRDELRVMAGPNALFDIQDQPWTNAARMAQARPFDNVTLGGSQQVRDAMNRTVLIGLASLGQCSLAP